MTIETKKKRKRKLLLIFHICAGMRPGPAAAGRKKDEPWTLVRFSNW